MDIGEPAGLDVASGRRAPFYTFLCTLYHKIKKRWAVPHSMCGDSPLILTINYELAILEFQVLQSQSVVRLLDAPKIGECRLFPAKQPLLLLFELALHDRRFVRRTKARVAHRRVEVVHELFFRRVALPERAAPQQRSSDRLL